MLPAIGILKSAKGVAATSVLLAALAVYGWQAWQLRAARSALAEAQAAAVELRAQRDEAVAINGRLNRRIDEQNRAVQAMRQTGEERARRASRAATRVLNAPAPPPPAGSGPAVMNEAMRRFFDESGG